MRNENKGQQFMPFDALKGLRNELEKREEVKVEMPLYSEEVIEKLSSQLSRIKKNDYAKIKYFRNHRYYTVEGKVTEVNQVMHTITIGRTKIYFETIIEIDEEIND